MKKGIYCTILAALLTASVFVLPIINPGTLPSDTDSDNVGKSSTVITDQKKKPSTAPEIDTPESDETVTFIIEIDGNSLCDTVISSGGKYKNTAELIGSKDIRQYTDTIKKSQAVVKASIRKMLPEVSLDGCYTYNTVINGFSVTAPYSCLEKLQKISGVRSVTLASSRMMSISENEPEDDSGSGDIGISVEPPDVSDNDTAANADKITLSDYTSPQNDMTKISAAYEQGFTGSGKVIAVIDDSFNCNHEAFSEIPSVQKYSAENIEKLTSSAAFNTTENAVITKSGKIIFAYDYAGKDDDTYSSVSSHGTHTAAVAAGNNGDNDADSFISGAYDAQLILMKVCPDGSSKVNDDTLLAAIDDAAKLSPDIINISLGVPRISTTENIFTKAINAISETGTYIVSAAGNYSENVTVSNENGINSDYTDYGTISYPAALQSVTAVGSLNTSEHISDYLLTDKNQKIEYRNILTLYDDYSPTFEETSQQTEYVYTDSYGSETELMLFDLKDKIAVVKRGEISFTEKIKAAQDAHAAGIIIISTEPLYISFTAETRDIPSAVVGADAEKYFSENPTGVIGYSQEKSVFTSENGGKPSAFTSYGVTSDLRLKPDILAPGTDILSASNSGYSLSSGTSVSSAVISGSAALISQYISNSEPYINSRELNTAVSALMMNTADRIKYSDKLYYTPRLQGAGSLNIDNALSAAAYVVSNDGSGSVSMGDDEGGEYTFSLTLRSLSDKDTTYRIAASVQTDRLIQDKQEFYNTLTPESITEYTNVTFSYDDEEITEITVPTGESIDITAELKLSPAAVLSYLSKAKNGFYIDGYITLEPTDKTAELSVPFMGYCGSWGLADIFDASVYSNDEPVISGNSLMGVAAIGSAYPGVVLGKNMTTGECSADNICISKDTIRNYYDSQTAGSAFIIPNFYLLRDAANYTISVQDSSEKTVLTQNLGTISSFASGGYEAYTGLLRSFNSDGLKNLFSSIHDGKYTYTVSASAISSDGTPAPAQSVSYTFTADNTVPDKPTTKTYSKNGKVYLDVESADLNGIQGFILYTATKTGNKYTYSDKIDDLIESNLMDADSYTLISADMTDGTAKFTYDITYLYQQLKRVKTHADFSDNESLAERKLVVRAVDNAYNLSSPVTADSTVSGTITYKLVDQNGRPVSRAVMMLSNMTAESGEDGIIVFENVLPDSYGVKLLSVPDEYTTDFTAEAIFTTIDSTEYTKTIRFNFSGEYLPDQESNLEPSEEPTEEESLSDPAAPPESFDNDSSTFALGFIGTLLIISTASLAVSRKKRLS